VETSSRFAYSDRGARSAAMWEELKDLKRQFPLLAYLRRHNWTPRPIGSRQ